MCVFFFISAIIDVHSSSSLALFFYKHTLFSLTLDKKEKTWIRCIYSIPQIVHDVAALYLFFLSFFFTYLKAVKLPVGSRWKACSGWCVCFPRPESWFGSVYRYVWVEMTHFHADIKDSLLRFIWAFIPLADFFSSEVCDVGQCVCVKGWCLSCTLSWWKSGVRWGGLKEGSGSSLLSLYSSVPGYNDHFHKRLWCNSLKKSKRVREREG